MPVDTNGEVSVSEKNKDNILWLQAFEARQGRPLRVLHIGNIANNAYLNAKFLRSVGVDAHVVSHDYQHVMSTPEWEEVELQHGHGDDYLPVFSKQDLQGYNRPNWFINGPLVVCVLQISELFAGRPFRFLRALKFILSLTIALTTKIFGERAGYAIGLMVSDPRLLLCKLWVTFALKLGADRHKLNAFIFARGAQQRQYLRELFEQDFPSRTDQLTGNDIIPYQMFSKYYRKMFDHYDIIQCYATEPIHGLLAAKRPYIAFEHGTLRDFTMADDPLHRLTALAYKNADHTFITNGDCLAYAERLGIKSHSPIIHPIDVDQHRQDFGKAVPELRQKIGGDVILFCPIRHDWAVKGTDVHLRALPMIKERLEGQVKLVLVSWGAQLDDSKALIKELGCEDDVVWYPSMCRITMIKHLQAADVVLDQMALPHFGSTAPQSIATGTPVISSYVPESTAYIIPEPAPILPAFSPCEVADAVVQALAPDWRADYKKRARHWIDTYHHQNNVIKDQLSVYQRLLECEANEK